MREAVTTMEEDELMNSDGNEMPEDDDDEEEFMGGDGNDMKDVEDEHLPQNRE